MMKIPFKIERTSIWPIADAAYLVPGQHDPCEAIGEAVIQSLSTEIEITAGGVTLHLGAWMDPDHWSSDWAKQGVEDPYEFITGLMSEDA